MKYLLLIFSLSLGLSSKAQNLVLNPSFEEYYTCPIGGQVNGFIKHWFAFTGGGGAQCFNECEPNYSVPQSGMNFQYAYSGVGYIRVKVYLWEEGDDSREYIEGSLSLPLTKDSIYCVSYWINLPERTRGAIKNIDAHLSDTLLDWNNGFWQVLKGIEPHITCDTLMQDTANWYQVKGMYKARGGEKYITIGNFLPREQTTFKLLSEMFTNVTYFIDEVSVVPLGLAAPALGPDTVLCSSNFPYQLQAPPGYDSYLWSTGATSAVLTVTEPGTYWLRSFAGDCGYLTDSVVISSPAVPELSLGNDTTICKGTSLTLSAQSGFASYSWSSGQSSQNISVTEPGTYTVTAQHACGTRQETISIQIDSVPDISLGLGPDTTLCADGFNAPLNLSASALLPNYLWSTGANTQSITVTRKGTYTLQSNFACGTLSDSITVSECPPFISIPNVFTPNGDGINDIWEPVIKNAEIKELVIFNRWGKTIYRSMTSNSWKPEDETTDGIYFYYLRYADLDGVNYEKKGTLSILK